MTTRPRSTDPTAIELDQVRTTADAAAWLRHRSAAFTTRADNEPSPVRARALGLAGSTLEVYADTVGATADLAGISSEINRIADEYRHPDRDVVEPLPEYYRLTCQHLADTLGELAQRLAHVAAAQHHRHSVGRPVGARPIEL